MATPILFNLTLIVFALCSNELTLGIIGLSVLIAGLLQLALNFSVSAYLGCSSFNFHLIRDCYEFSFKISTSNICSGNISIKCTVDTI